MGGGFKTDPYLNPVIRTISDVTESPASVTEDILITIVEEVTDGR